MLSDILGIDIEEILSLPGLASSWSGEDIAGLMNLDAGNISERFADFLFGGGGGGVIPNIPAISIPLDLDLVSRFIEIFYGGSPPAGASLRPAISFSGSFGGQFFGGGSAGLSIQLDAGKSTSKSEGSQGQINETLTYNQPDNQTYMDAWVEDADVSRYNTRHHFYERDKEYVWKGREIQYGRKPHDIVLMTIPVRTLLTPQEEPLAPDSFRIRVGYLPTDVCLDVTFVGTAYPVAPRASSTPFPKPAETSTDSLAQGDVTETEPSEEEINSERSSQDGDDHVR